MEKNKFIAIVLAFMLPLLSCYSQSNNKRGDKTLSNQQDTSKKDEANKANSAAVSSFIGKLMSNKQDTSKKVEGIPTNPAAPANHIARDNATTVRNNGKAYRSCPDNNHPHMIDLGLPSGTKWACCNVGASTPEGYGGYYAWGETKEKKVYDWNTYIHCDGSMETCHNLGKDIARTKYDVAHVRWGGGWRMPSREQILELEENCTYEQTTMNGVKGGKFTSKTKGGFIFLPAAGYRWYSELRRAGCGFYWSSALDALDEVCAYDLFFSSSPNGWEHDGRYLGQSVRPVR